MQLVTGKRLAIDSHRKNRFPLDAFWEMGIYSSAKTTGFAECVQIQFSHRWVNWESICPAVGIYPHREGRLAPCGDLADQDGLEIRRKGRANIGCQAATSNLFIFLCSGRFFGIWPPRTKAA
ncbi:hypothetical protein Pan181_45050 [Aeoliella mucimassa]|uniref:Uncharacterized protein n=1 Tax=Aeoliella mucimassa TaxID=2527972 RepID=A0A518AU80_9BACT|nr:hypothetical protein Pan181_45050 [Aeoliella mucimassa]